VHTEYLRDFPDVERPPNLPIVVENQGPADLSRFREITTTWLPQPSRFSKGGKPISKNEIPKIRRLLLLMEWPERVKLSGTRVPHRSLAKPRRAYAHATSVQRLQNFTRGLRSATKPGVV
jgi:hypothetical protein